jgi:hypothetical protein
VVDSMLDRTGGQAKLGLEGRHPPDDLKVLLHPRYDAFGEAAAKVE